MTEKIVYLFINDDSGLPMDVPRGDTAWTQVGETMFSRDEDTGELEIVVRVRPLPMM
jgi:hypothetical protein